MSNYGSEDCIMESMAIPAMENEPSPPNSEQEGMSEDLQTFSVRVKGKGKRIVIHDNPDRGDGTVPIPDSIPRLCPPAIPVLEGFQKEKKKILVHNPESKVMEPRKHDIVFEANPCPPMEKPLDELQTLEPEPNLDDEDFRTSSNIKSLCPPQPRKRRCSSPSRAQDSTPEKVFRMIINGPNTQFLPLVCNKQSYLMAVAPIYDSSVQAAEADGSRDTEVYGSGTIDTPPPLDQKMPRDEYLPPETSGLPSHIPQTVQSLAEEDPEVQSNQGEDEGPLDLSCKPALIFGKRESEEMEVAFAAAEYQEPSVPGLQMDGSAVDATISSKEPVPAGLGVAPGHIKNPLEERDFLMKKFQLLAKSFGPAKTQKLLENAYKMASINLLSNNATHLQSQSSLGAVADRFYGRLASNTGPAGNSGQQMLVTADAAIMSEVTSGPNITQTTPLLNLHLSTIPTAFLQDQKLISENGELQQSDSDIVKAQLKNKLVNKSRH